MGQLIEFKNTYQSRSYLRVLQKVVQHLKRPPNEISL